MPDNKITGVVQQVTGDVHRILSQSSDDVQSYANQLQQCRNMRQHLGDLDDEILRLTQTYHTAMMSLQQEQYVNEELQSLARVLEQFAPQAEALSSHLRMRHLAYIDERARQVTATMNEALGG